MFGLKICEWCDATLWWWTEDHKVQMKCADGNLEVHICEDCWKTFNEFNEYVEEMKAKQEEYDETFRRD